MLVPESQLTNIQALQIARNYNFQLKVIMRDQLEDIPKTGYYLINLNNEGEPGSQWCGLV